MDRENINISQFIDPTSEMRISFKVSDYNPYNHLVEAGIDAFEVYEDNSLSTNYDLANGDIIYPNPAENQINYFHCWIEEYIQPFWEITSFNK